MKLPQEIVGWQQLLVWSLKLEKAIVKPNDSSGGNWNKHLSRFFVSTNLSLVQSRVDMTTVLVEDETSDPNEVAETELENRQSNARVGQNIDRYRSMSGQSPYAINVSLSYELPDNSTSVSVSYNVQGEQLTIIGFRKSSRYLYDSHFIV